MDTFAARLRLRKRGNMTLEDYYPDYPFPWVEVIRLIPSILTKKKQSFHQLSLNCTNRLSPPLSIIGGEHIPGTGPCLIVVNHYYRPGFQAYWIALAISAIIPAEIHWIMASAWTYPGKFLGKQRESLTRWLFQRLAGIYGFSSMPPMPPRPWETSERASAVRHVLDYAKNNPGAMIALAPEGQDRYSGIIELPDKGVGRFIYQLHKTLGVINPVGVYEQDGHLTLQFGVPFSLDQDLSSYPKEELDRNVRITVMKAIANCLPLERRGDFTQ